MPNTTPGLTWRSDAHVLLAVHHEASHRLPVGVVGCALTYWKSAEGFLFFLTTLKRVHVASRPHIVLAPCLRTPRMTASGEKTIYGSNQAAALTSLRSLGLISSREFGNK